MKYRIGQRVKSLDEDRGIGIIKETDGPSYFVYFKEWNHGHDGHGTKKPYTGNHCWWLNERDLQKVGGSMDSVSDLNVGDVLVDKYGTENKVLAISGLVVALSDGDSFGEMGGWWTIDDLKEFDFKLKESETEELTVSEISKRLGYDVKVVK